MVMLMIQDVTDYAYGQRNYHMATTEENRGSVPRAKS